MQLDRYGEEDVPCYFLNTLWMFEVDVRLIIASCVNVMFFQELGLLVCTIIPSAL